jgi:hypothetical protein
MKINRPRRTDATSSSRERSIDRREKGKPTRRIESSIRHRFRVREKRETKCGKF